MKYARVCAGVCIVCVMLEYACVCKAYIMIVTLSYHRNGPSPNKLKYARACASVCIVCVMLEYAIL